MFPSNDSVFSMQIEDVFSIKGRGTVVTGKIDSGTIKLGDEVLIQSQRGERKTFVVGIEMFRKMLDQAKAGDNVGILLKDIGKGDVQPGDVLVGSNQDFT